MQCLDVALPAPPRIYRVLPHGIAKDVQLRVDRRRVRLTGCIRRLLVDNGRIRSVCPLSTHLAPRRLQHRDK